MDDTVYLRDIDGTGSMHVCVKGDAGAVEYVPAATLTAQAAEIARRDVLLHEALQLLDANIRSKTRDDNAEQQLHVKIRRNLTGSQSHD